MKTKKLKKVLHLSVWELFVTGFLWILWFREADEHPFFFTVTAVGLLIVYTLRIVLLGTLYLREKGHKKGQQGSLWSSEAMEIANNFEEDEK